MRRIVTAFATTVTAIVLLFSYHTSTGGSGTPTAAVVRPVTPAAAAGATTSSAATTYTGDVAQTRWGPVQVTITVAGGTITAADAVQVPTGNQRDDEINAVAVPILDQAVVSAQSAQIDTVSGATVTSDGYLASLQSAIDQAHL
ncbi:MAG: FMN-binding protein [Actinomycetota bacterium]